MVDRYGRVISYLRISVTDSCNLRCHYCAPAGTGRRVPRELLSVREITEVARAAVGLGMTKLRITGGEPTVRQPSAGDQAGPGHRTDRDDDQRDQAGRTG